MCNFRWIERKMLRKFIIILVLFLPIFSNLFAQNRNPVYPGADEKTPSKAQYFSWINNTNEGPTEAQTLINLEFFRWLYEEYEMHLDIYAFDAGAIDGKRFYGRVDSDRFRGQFPNGFEPIYEAAKREGNLYRCLVHQQCDGTPSSGRRYLKRARSGSAASD